MQFGPMTQIILAYKSFFGNIGPIWYICRNFDYRKYFLIEVFK